MFLRAAGLPLRWFYALTVLAASAWAASSTAWEMTTWQDFQRGKFSSVSLTRDGRLTLAPAVSTLYSDGQSVVWSAAQASDGTIYFGTGHKGSVVKLDPAGKTSVIWSAPEPEVFAVAVDARGAVYAATSPDGKVYKIENGKASEYFNPKEKYIWSLAISPKSGTVFAGTGEGGKIYQVTSPGQGEVYFDRKVDLQKRDQLAKEKKDLIERERRLGGQSQPTQPPLPALPPTLTEEEIDHPSEP